MSLGDKKKLISKVIVPILTEFMSIFKVNELLSINRKVKFHLKEVNIAKTILI